jgi:hypothetical protein
MGNLTQIGLGEGRVRRRVHQDLSANPATAGKASLSLDAGLVNLAQAPFSFDIASQYLAIYCSFHAQRLPL